MPELPEVEVVRRRLDAWAAGKVILRARVPKSRVLGTQSPRKVATFLAGRRIESVERRGKSMLLRLSDEGALHLHLGMSGSISDGGGPKPKHVRLELALDDGTEVRFDDPRMFGRVAVGPWAELTERYFLPLGPDPLLGELTPATLAEILGRSRRPIKIALMEQGLIAGIGNIYASEALWRSKLDPRMPANAIDRPGARRLAAAIRRTFLEAIERLEAGERYLSQGGVNAFRVYDHAGERCPRCRRAVIQKMEQGGRSTYWCPRCQLSASRRR